MTRIQLAQIDANEAMQRQREAEYRYTASLRGCDEAAQKHALRELLRADHAVTAACLQVDELRRAAERVSLVRTPLPLPNSRHLFQGRPLPLP